MFKTTLKIVFIFLIMFVIFGVGRSSKKMEIYDNCIKYHGMQTAEDAKETCEDILRGDRYAIIERSESKISEEVFK
jgi:hypothetical protein